jgi:hypothetical protein
LIEFGSIALWEIINRVLNFLDFIVFFNLRICIICNYSRTCIKRSAFGTKNKWPYKTGDLFKRDSCDDFYDRTRKGDL